jgi:hypothetical protein
MKCVMRIVTVAQADVSAVAPMLVGKLTEILSELCQGFAHGIAPKNPAFHHFIFESLAAVIRHVCASGDAGAVKSMEDVMLPPFQVGRQTTPTISPHIRHTSHHIHTYIHTRTHARTHTHTHIHTYIHTYTHSLIARTSTNFPHTLLTASHSNLIPLFPPPLSSLPSSHFPCPPPPLPSPPSPS